MKISEFIDLLSQIKESQGDLDVRIEIGYPPHKAFSVEDYCSIIVDTEEFDPKTLVLGRT